MTRFFIAGATGYTGQHLVRLASRAGIETVAHVRPDSPSLASWTERFEALGVQVDTTPWEQEAMDQTLARRSPTHVFGLLGTTKARRRRGTGSAIEESYEQVDYGLSALLHRSASALPSAPRYVYLSAYGVTPRSGNRYLQARARMEAELRAGSIPWLIIRPAIISGEDRSESRAAERVSAAMVDTLLGVTRLVGARQTWERFRTRSGEELAEGILYAALYAPEGSELDGASLEALVREHA